MIKAEKPKGIPERFNPGQINRGMLVYIGNVYGDSDRTWPTPGTELRSYDVFRRLQMTKAQRQGLEVEIRKEQKLYNRHMEKKSVKLPGDNSSPAYVTMLRQGIARGDAFLVYGTGVGYVVRKRQDGQGFWLSRLKKAERVKLMNGERHVRRNLRWARGSFCEGEETSKWASTQ